MYNVNYLLGEKNIKKKIFEPYDPLICKFINDISNYLFNQNKNLKFPEVVAFAYWCRKSNLDNLKKNFINNKFRIGRGLIFHVAPSNVPVNFAYSFIFGLLSGNSNIIKLSSKKNEVSNIILNCFRKLFLLKKYKLIKDSNLFISYSPNDEITKHYSLMSNCRLIWGGDKTIKNLKKIVTSPRCFDITFSDRYSFSLINLNFSNDNQLQTLANNFFNDSYVMNQNACSSPHLIVWMGNIKKNRSQVNKFWLYLKKIVSKKYVLDNKFAISKYLKQCEVSMSLKKIKKFHNYENLIFRTELLKLNEKIENVRGVNGSFYEFYSKDMNFLKKIVNEKFQTLSYFGLEKDNILLSIKDNNIRGIDRIVPIGNALNISLDWDGFDIITSLSRVIDVR